MQDQTQADGQSAIENITLEEEIGGPYNNPRPSPARRSGGPSSPEGKRRSSQNARRHGLYTDEDFLQSAALELGEDPRQFQRLLKGLIAARRPVGTLELAVIEDIALLLLKKSRLDKAELAVQVSNLQKHDFQRRKQMLQVGDNDSDTTEFDARDDGLRRHLDCPGRYGQALELLGRILGLINLDEFGFRMQEAMRVLYGGAHTLRGAALDNFRRQLSKLKPEDKDYEPVKLAMTKLLAREIRAVERHYELYLQEHVTNRRSARVAATAPSHAQWTAIIRQQNSLHRQMEHKIRLLMELQRERRELEKMELGKVLGNSLPPDVGAALVAAQEQPQGLPLQPAGTGEERAADMPEGGRCSAGVPPAEAGASRSGTPAEPALSAAKECPRDRGRDARATAESENREKCGNELEDLLQTQGISENGPEKRTGFHTQNEGVGMPGGCQTYGKTALK